MTRRVPLHPSHSTLALVLILAMAGTRDAQASGPPQTAAKAPSSMAREESPAPGALHVPSPDWRDQIVYFAMIDRFDDGDPRNNDQGAGEYDPRDPARYSGGDLAGLLRRLDYIRGLGATALWITPPVANQWWNTAANYGGYHGYWAEDFQRIDPHFGTLADYRALSQGLHGRGMYLVQDIVVNHTANYFGYVGGWSADDPSAHFVLHPPADGQRRTAPSRWPFSLNDARRPHDRRAGIYHWTPDITDFSDRNQELNYQLAGLDDLNTENPQVRDALRAAYGHWIREAGVDAFRVDTAFYVPPAFFADFLRAADPGHPGILEVAARTGRQGFHVFGEGFGIDAAFEDTQARRIDGYMRGADGQPLLPGMINFPLYGTLLDVFARGRPTAELQHRIESTMKVHDAPHLMPTFVDNHDVDRFLAGGSKIGLKQSLLAIMTLPGIPTIYYGTEQGFIGQRAAMFASGNGAAGSDHFDAAAPLYRYLQRAIALRRDHRVFSRGEPTVLSSNAATSGAIAWRMAHEGEAALVALNTSDRPTLIDNLDTGLPAGTRLRGLFAIDGAAPPMTVGASGRLNIVLPPGAGLVWQAEDVASVDAPVSAITLDAGLPARVRDDLAIGGRARGARTLQLVVDGDLGAAVPVSVALDGRWQARIDTRDMVDPVIPHTVVLRDPDTGVVSDRHVFHVEREWTLLGDHQDPKGDDNGPRASYSYPADAGWRTHRPADLRGVRAWSSGGSLRLELRMRDVTASWNPANGFDHVAFTVFLQLPSRDGGSAVMPLQNASLPVGMQWHYRLRTHGWSNVLFSSEGASATDEGTIANVSARVSADAENETVTLTFPARALGGMRSLSGARIYITTWDYDGGYRPLAAQAGPHAFGGGDGTRDPLVMDDLLLELP